MIATVTEAAASATVTSDEVFQSLTFFCYFKNDQHQFWCAFMCVNMIIITDGQTVLFLQRTINPSISLLLLHSFSYFYSMFALNGDLFSNSNTSSKAKSTEENRTTTHTQTHAKNQPEMVNIGNTKDIDLIKTAFEWESMLWTLWVPWNDRSTHEHWPHHFNISVSGDCFCSAANKWIFSKRQKKIGNVASSWTCLESPFLWK